MYCDQRTVCTSFYIRFTTFTHYSIKSNKFIHHRLLKFDTLTCLLERYTNSLYYFLYQRLKKIYIYNPDVLTDQVPFSIRDKVGQVTARLRAEHEVDLTTSKFD